MKLHAKFEHQREHTWTWGKRGEADLRVNFGKLKAGDVFLTEPLHYHKTRKTYFCVVDGGLKVEVNGRVVEITESAMLEVEPLEKYRVMGVGAEGCLWVTIGNNNIDDKVEVF